MSMPYVDDEIEDDEDVIETVEDFEIEGKNVKLNISDGDITVRDGDAATLTGLEALRQWIEKAFKTRAHIYEIYEEEESGDEFNETVTFYGSECKDILLNPELDWNEKTADIQQDIENTLNRHPDIIAVSDFVFSQEGRSLTVSFLVSSIYGDLGQEVTINGADT